MKIDSIYSHLNGLEFVKFHKLNLWNEIEVAITSVDARSQCRRLSTPLQAYGGARYAAMRVRKEFEARFRAKNWLGNRASCDVDSDSNGVVSKDFSASGRQRASIVKDRVAIELQFGNNGHAVFRQLAFYVRNLIDVGVVILPVKAMRMVMSCRGACYEIELYNLIREGRGVPGVPPVLVGVAP
jgi:hypothetical protein